MMKRLLQKVLKYLVYSGTAVIILLAVAVGLFRLFLPRLPEYQEEIKDWANEAIGMQVEFSGMDARWRLRGPELNFYDAELRSRDHPDSAVDAEEVRVGVGLMRLLLDRELVVERMHIRDTDINVSRSADGSWSVQGMPLNELLELRSSVGRAGPLTIDGENIRINYTDVEPGHAFALQVETAQFQRDNVQHGVQAALVLPSALGKAVDVAATQRLTLAGSNAPWQVFIEGQDVDAAGFARLAPAGWPPVASGTADLSLWFEASAEGIRSATANFELEDVVADSELKPFAAEGRIEFSRSGGGWVVAADEFHLDTAGGRWPESSFQLRVTEAGPEAASSATGRASWINLDDLAYVAAWMPLESRNRLAALAASGVVRDLELTVADLDAGSSNFELSATMDRFGCAAFGGWPGVRGFSGQLQADHSGGRLEMHSADLEMDFTGHLLEPVVLEELDGTVVWRHNESGTTLLSNSVRAGNGDFDTVSSFQITLPLNGASPTVDVKSKWSIEDVSTIERYLPVNGVKPGLYRWLRSALVAGRVPEGSLRLSGALNEFPFDDDSGFFQAEATLEDGELLYSEHWPAARNLNGTVVIDNARLYSVRNSAVNAGNSVVDADIEIADLRNPVLTINGKATGTLETIRRFSLESPIADVFGGQLDRVVTDGEASFDLMLSYPILDREDYDFRTSIQTDNGTIRVDGLPSPITELNGSVTVTRDKLHAESLSARFFDEPVAIELMREDDPGSPVSVVAKAKGVISGRGLASHIPAMAENLLQGSTHYAAEVRFPAPGVGASQPLTVDVWSAFEGMALTLPDPLGKHAGVKRPMSLAIEIPGDGRVKSSGALGDDLRWSVNFLRSEAGWDFDRGVLAIGGEMPGEPKTRGLHVEGRLPLLDFDEWLARVRGESDGPGYADRIRSIELDVANLRVIGQHLTNHRIVVNRSAQDWAVRLDGEQAMGNIAIPYDFNGDRPVRLDMERLVLPGGDDDKRAAGSGTYVMTEPDPRTLPGVIVRADDFSLGKRHLGRFRADFVPTPAGLEADVFETSNDSFDIRGKAGWVVDETDVSLQRSYVSARLTSRDVATTLRSLDYDLGIKSQSLDAKFDVSWSGGPRQDLLSSLDGSVSVRFDSGQLDEVEPGAGRVFGLMSIVALPRRLSLDFRDVFDRGLGFDEITGTFRLDDGQAYTCDLSLKGPAADVGIAGRTGLLSHDYQQTAVVSANVGNTLPVVGAVVAGPQVAAALLIFSQIFKKPLQEMGQIYYSIEGSWDDPAIEAANAERFAETTRVAGCLKGST